MYRSLFLHGLFHVIFITLSRNEFLVEVGLYTMLFGIGELLVISNVFVFISLACTSDGCLQPDCLLFDLNTVLLSTQL